VERFVVKISKYKIRRDYYFLAALRKVRKYGVLLQEAEQSKNQNLTPQVSDFDFMCADKK
jgi:hypothetical protein